MNANSFIFEMASCPGERTPRFGNTFIVAHAGDLAHELIEHRFLLFHLRAAEGTPGNCRRRRNALLCNATGKRACRNACISGVTSFLFISTTIILCFFLGRRISQQNIFLFWLNPSVPPSQLQASNLQGITTARVVIDNSFNCTVLPTIV